eukprot:CAMPEP_0173201162 /NCGR_PEP_ID=MMETSP1141-20130122/18196_1 /TAXON_ID=483371 /ORGANISM="non described non described, Strain CCMP2298" /LENGTH=113 /DNA_ID=CAMNT_0014126249 /DNA_START=75 /DNA_END=413 /DNA_ORIENTATION=+
MRGEVGLPRTTVTGGGCARLRPDTCEPPVCLYGMRVKASAMATNTWELLCARLMLLDVLTDAANSMRLGMVSSSEHIDSGNIDANMRKNATIRRRLFWATCRAPFIPRKYREW